MDLALLNVRSFASEASRLEVLKILKIYQPKVMGLIETHARVEENCELVLNHQYCSSPQSATRVGGVGFVFRTDGTNWTFRAVNERLATLRLLWNGQWLGFISCYAPTENAHETAKVRFFRELRREYNTLVHNCSHVVIFDDWNCVLGRDAENETPVKYSFADEGLTSDNGQRVLQFATSKKLRLMNCWFDGQRKFRHSWSHPKTGRTSLKDIAIASAQFMEFVVSVKTTRFKHSDHRLVIIKVKHAELKKVNRKLVDSSRHKQPGMRKVNAGRPDFGSDREERSKLKRECEHWWRTNGTRSPNEFLERLITCQNRVFATKIPHENESPPENSSDLIAWTRDTLKKNKRKGKTVSDSRLAQHAKKLFDTRSERERLPGLTPRQVRFEPLGDLPSMEELELAIGKMKTNTSPGRSGVCPELLKFGGAPMRESLLEYFKSLWPVSRGGGGGELPSEFKGAKVVGIYKHKGNRDDPANYRTIFLLDIVGKVLFRLLNKRLEALTEPFLIDEQNGFRTGRSTVNSILCLTLLQERAMLVQKPLVVAFLDVKKAFDSVPRALIFQALAAAGCPEALLHFYRAVHSEVWGQVGNEARFEVNRGVRQGSVEGPTLFNVAYQCVILEALGQVPGIGVKLAGVGGFDSLRVSGGPREITVELLVFADDLCLLASSPAILTNGIKRICEVGGPLGITIEPSKSQALWLSNRPMVPEKVLANNLAIPEVEEVKYLGILVQNEKRATQSLENASLSIERAIKALSEVAPVLKRKDVTKKQRAQIVATYVLPALLYGCEATRWNGKMIRAIESFLRRLKNAIGVKRPISGLPVTARKAIAIRRVSFLVRMVVNPRCITVRDILTSRFEGTVRGGRCSANYGRTVASDFAYISGDWHEPMVALGFLIQTAEEEKRRLEVQIDARTRRPELAALWDERRKRVLNR